MNTRIVVVILALLTALPAANAQTTYWLPTSKVTVTETTYDFDTKAPDYLVDWLKAKTSIGGGDVVAKTIKGKQYQFVKQTFSWPKPLQSGMWIEEDSSPTKFGVGEWKSSNDLKTQSAVIKALESNVKHSIATHAKAEVLVLIHQEDTPPRLVFTAKASDFDDSKTVATAPTPAPAPMPQPVPAIDPAVLAFDPPSLAFVWQKGGPFPPSQSVLARNCGGYTIHSGFWANKVRHNWVPGGCQMDIGVDPVFAKLDVGIHETKILLESNGMKANLLVKITVVSTDGTLQVNRKRLHFGGFLGDAIKEQVIDVTYTGVGTTNWTASGLAWLKLAQAGGTIAATDPTTLTVGINTAAIKVAGRNSGTLTVRDGKTTHEIPVDLSLVPPGSPTIELFGLEVTQGIQNLFNDIPFVANRPTFVRGHVWSLSGDPIDKATAELVGTRDGAKLGSLAPINPGGSINIIANPDRGKLDESFLFQLPESWLTGTVTLRLEGKSQPIAYLLPRPVLPRPLRTQAKADSGWVPQAVLELGIEGSERGTVIVHHEREGKIIGRYVFLGLKDLPKDYRARFETHKQILTQAGYDTKEIVGYGVIAPHSKDHPLDPLVKSKEANNSKVVMNSYYQAARFGDVLRFEKVGGEPGGENERQYVVNSTEKGEWFSPKTTSGETYRIWRTKVDVLVGMGGALPTPVPRKPRVSTTEPASADPAEKSLTGGVANDGEDRPLAVTLTFQTIPALPIEYYLYSEEGSVTRSDGKTESMTYTANAVHAAATSQQLLAGLPIPRVDDTIHPTTSTYSGNRIGNQDKVDAIMRETYEKAGSPLHHTYGLFARYEPSTDPKAQPAGGPGGAACVPGFFGFGEYYTFQSMATLNMHEIGHNLGRNHVDCGKPASPDPEYPHANHQISDELTGPAAYYGFNIVNKDIYPPTHKDYMSYCHPSWISPYTYKAMFERLKIHYNKPDSAVGKSAGSPGAPILLVSGSITGAGTATVAGSIDRVVDDNANAAIPIPAADGSKYSVRLLDASGGTIATYPVTPEKSESQAAEGHDHGEFTSFTLAVPRPKKMARVVLLHENKPLAERKASANAPTVTLTTPLVGKVFGNQAIPLTWKAGDVDGNELRFNVDYSINDGATWHVLARNWSETTLQVESSRLSGSAKARLRVSANDGFLTTFAVSDAFTVSDHPPVAVILSKDLNRYYVGGQTILLKGTGYDFEDGVVNELTWYSDRDGKLGTGKTLLLDADRLAEGAHVIRLEAKDSKGQSSFGDPAASVAASADDSFAASDSVRFNVHLDPLSVPAELLAASVMSGKTQRIEAEAGTYAGGAGTADYFKGFEGTGFAANFLEGGEDALKVSTDQAGVHDLVIRYAAGQDGPESTRTMSLYVNGSRTRQLSFERTGNWLNWANQTAKVQLKSGENTISFRVDKDDTGYINLDYVILGVEKPQYPSPANAGLTNPGFEEPRGKEASFAFAETMPGWKTTDKEFEIWSSGFEGVAAHEGTQFVELNAWIDGTLYQDSTGIQPGSVLEFTFAHRGRSGEDTMKLTITDLGADNSPDGGDDTVLFTNEYTTGKDAWAVYDSTKEKQIKALGNTVRFAYGAISTATGAIGAGNFLDAANFGVGVVSLQQAAKGATLTFEWSGRVGNNSSAALGGKVVGDNGWRLNGTPLAADTVITFSYTIPDTAKDTDGSPSAGRYTEGTLNVSIPSMDVNSAPNKDYHLMFGTDDSSDYVVAQPFDNTGFALVANWPATADPWPNPNVLSTIANPKASNIFGTSPDSKFTLTLKSGDVLTTAFTELLANPVFSSSSSAKPTPPANAMKLDINGGPFTFGYRTTAKPGFTEFPNTDSPHPGISRRNRTDGEYFSFAQNTRETELKVQETGLVHYPAKAEGGGVLCPGQNPGDVAIARFTAMDDGEYHFKITAELIEEKPTGAGVTVYVDDKVVDQKQLTGHLVPWATSFQRKLTKGQTVDIAVDSGVDKNWEKDHVLVTAKAWTTSPSNSTVKMVTVGDSETNKADAVEHILTKDLENQKGAVWSEQKFDFNENFAISAEIYLGTKNDGADGLALVFQAKGNHIVSDGGGLGYQGISPSIAIEFDTYHNGDKTPKQKVNVNNNDPVEDHVGIRTDGDPVHTASDYVEVRNLEDGKYHPITFEWNASQQAFNLSLDGKQIFKERSIPKNGLAGQQVYFGFTAATGGLSNEHKVRSISFPKR